MGEVSLLCEKEMLAAVSESELSVGFFDLWDCVCNGQYIIIYYIIFQ